MYTLNKYSKRHRLLAPAPLLPGVHFGEAATASSALTKKRKLGPYSIRLAREQEYRSLCLPLVIILPLPSSWHFHYQPIHPPANPHIPAAAASHTPSSGWAWWHFTISLSTRKSTHRCRTPSSWHFHHIGLNHVNFVERVQHGSQPPATEREAYLKHHAFRL